MKKIFSNIFMMLVFSSFVYSQDTIRTYYSEDSLIVKEVYEVTFGTDIYNGFYKFYLENGQLVEHREFKDGRIWNIINIYDSIGNIIKNKGTLKNGDGTTHNYFDGHLMTICTYKNGIRHGQYIKFWENGVVQETGNYYEGEQCGTWYNYQKNGHLPSGHKTVYSIECGNGEVNKDWNIK